MPVLGHQSCHRLGGIAPLFGAAFQVVHHPSAAGGDPLVELVRGVGGTQGSDANEVEAQRERVRLGTLRELRRGHGSRTAHRA